MTKLYTDHNILWVKHATNQKAESIRIVSFSKLDKRSTAAVSSIQSMLNSLKNDRCSFISQSYLCIQQLLQSATKIRSSTSVNFHLPIPPLLDHKIIFTIRTNTPFLYTSAIFHLPTSYTKKYFPYLNHLANSGCVKGPGN